MKNELKQENCSIDMVKAICAVLVVLQHMSIYYGEKIYQSNIVYFLTQMLGRTAVPFFYIVSGYYFNRALMNGENALKKQGIKTIKIYLLWSIFYIPLNLYNYVIEDGWSILNIIKRFFVDIFFFGTHYQLYYIIALLISMCLTTYFYRIGKLKIYAVFSIFLYLFGTLITSYPNVLNGLEIINRLVSFKYFIFIRRYFFIAPGFFMMGFWFNYFSNEIEKLKKQSGIITLLCALFMFFEELFIVRHGGQNMMGIGIYLFIFFLFTWCLNNPIPYIYRYAQYARSFSNFSYFVHPIIFSIVCYGIGIENYIVATVMVFILIVSMHALLKKQTIVFLKKLC